MHKNGEILKCPKERMDYEDGQTNRNDKNDLFGQGQRDKYFY